MNRVMTQNSPYIHPWFSCSAIRKITQGLGQRADGALWQLSSLFTLEVAGSIPYHIVLLFPPELLPSHS